MQRQIHLNLFIQSRGHHEASWRHPRASTLPLTDIDYYRDLAQRAEKARLDSVFLADQLNLPDDVAQVALIPVAYTLGTDFKTAPRKDLDNVLHTDSW